MERCTDCGRLADPRADGFCPVCGGRLEPLRIPITREPPAAPTSSEELVGRLLGIGA